MHINNEYAITCFVQLSKCADPIQLAVSRFNDNVKCSKLMKAPLLKMVDELRLNTIRYPNSYRCDMPSIVLERDRDCAGDDKFELILDNRTSATELRNHHESPVKDAEEYDSAGYIDDSETEVNIRELIVRYMKVGR